MKKLIIVLAGCLAGIPVLAQYPGDYEPFTYTSGGDLIGNGAWSDAGTGGASAGPTIGSDNLSYTGLQTSGGTDAQFGVGAENARLDLSSGGTGSYGGGSTLTVYFSYELQLSSADSAGPFEISGLDQKTSSAANKSIGSRGDGVMVEDNGSGTGYYIGFIRGGQNGTTTANSSEINWVGGGTGTTATAGTSTLFSYNTTLFIVGDYNFIDPAKNATSPASDNDTADLWVNPAASTFGNDALKPSADLSGVGDAGATSVADLNNIASFDLIQNDGSGNTAPQGKMDDVRVGLNWKDVTPAAAPVPEPSSMALGALALACICLMGFRQKYNVKGC